MAIFAKLNFQGRVELDGNEYRACAFRNCVLIYNGGKVDVKFCSFENATLECTDAAARTLQSLGQNELLSLRRL